MINEDAPVKRAPVSGKVANGTLGGGAVTLLVWALTYFIPSWHSAIPGGLETLLPGALGALGFYITGFASKHQATTDEVIHAVQKGEVILSQVENAIHPMIEAGIPVPPPPAGRPATGSFGRAIKDRPQA